MGFYLVSRRATPIPGECSRSQQFILQPIGHADLCRGCLIADIPAIVGSLDIVMGEIDR